jgi:hypothetical protein
MNYSLASKDADKIRTYGSLLVNAVSSGKSKVVYFSADNATFKANTASFEQSWTNAAFGTEKAPSLYETLTGFSWTAHDAFESHKITESMWKSMYKGA